MTQLLAQRPEAGDPLQLVHVEDVMHRGILELPVDAPLGEAARVMDAHDVHCVVVRGADQEADVDPDERLWGVVSELDLVSAAAIGGFAERTAGGTAVTPAVAVDLEDTLQHAAQTMCEHKVTHLVVTDRRVHDAVGVISALDIARVLAS
jgi:CBS domain-containing protein